MNPVVELLGAVSSGVEARLVSHPQKGSGEFQFLLDQARRAVRNPEGRASQPAEGSERLPESRRAERQGAMPRKASASGEEPADSRPAEGKPAEGGDESEVPSEAAASIVGSAATTPLGQPEGTVAALEGGLVEAVAQPDAALPGLESARPAVAPPPQSLPGHETGRNPSGSQPFGQAPAVHAAPWEQPGEAAFSQGRQLAGSPAQAGGAANGAAQARGGEASLAAVWAGGTERAHPFVRAAQGSAQEAGSGLNGAQLQLTANGTSVGAAALEGARSQLAFLFGSAQDAPVDEDVAQQAGLQPDADAASLAAAGRLEARTASPEELPEAAANDGADDAEALAHPARESAGQVQRQEGAVAARTEPPPAEEAAQSLPGYAKAGQAFEGSRSAPLARPALQQMVRSAQAQIGDDVSTLHLQLRPGNLGDLDLKVSIEHGVVTAKFVTHSLEVKALIESALPELRQSLQEQGVSVDQLTVSVGEERRDWRESGRDASERSGGAGPGYTSRASLEAATSTAAAASPRMWYSQGVDILV